MRMPDRGPGRTPSSPPPAGRRGPTPPRRAMRLAVLVALPALAGATLLPGAARAWFVGGIGFGVPVFVAPPPVVYAPPPVVVAPYPPVAYPVPLPPPPVAEAVAGTTCAAARYVCPLPAIAVVGTRCSCPTETGARVFGTIR